MWWELTSLLLKYVFVKSISIGPVAEIFIKLLLIPYKKLKSFTNILILNIHSHINKEFKIFNELQCWIKDNHYL